MRARPTTEATSASARLPPPVFSVASGVASDAYSAPPQAPINQPTPAPVTAERPMRRGEPPVGDRTDAEADRAHGGAEQQLAPVERRLFVGGDGDGEEHADGGEGPDGDRQPHRVGAGRCSSSGTRAASTNIAPPTTTPPISPHSHGRAGELAQHVVAVEHGERGEADGEAGDRAEPRPRGVGEVEQLVGGDEERRRDAHGRDDLEQRRPDGRAARRSRRGSRSPRRRRGAAATRRCRAGAAG